MKRKIFFLSIFLFSAVFLGCSDEKKPAYNGEEVNYIPKQELSIGAITIDTLMNDSLMFSGLGQWIVFNDSLIFFDKRQNLVYVFSEDLMHTSTYLGKGDGPNLINSAVQSLTVFGDYLAVLGSSYDYYLINKHWEIERKGMLDFNHEQIPYNQLMNQPNPDNVGIYEVLYEHLKFGHDYKGNLVFSIASTHPSFNYIWHEDFYKKGRILGIASPNDGKVSVKGTYSAIYQEYKFLSTLIGAPFSYIDASTYIQGYEVDSVLYKLDDSGKMHFAFGIPGKEMNIAYESFKPEDIDEFDARWSLDRNRSSYYHSLDFVEESGLLFRGYSKSNTVSDGLQIYKNDTLIGDVDVPKGFRFVGYKAPYYYGSFTYNPDREDDFLQILRFKLPHNG
ncbi:hypothetical protein [Mongoliitalea lutea]|uniref:DUF4221 domain-containing protein n=1 Tax=Mongoliitalea lutea TaxID=849756 RepID=A0A8J3D0D3_9BACT|nr:hypothetical protein [Mongoliitalea lutea]GHB44842.1 hypothetical protein GCM10008106_27400 [Mongoliitalea lutea]